MTRVCAGDNLGKLVRRHWGRSSDQLVNKISRLNHLRSKNSLRIGQNIFVTPTEIRILEERIRAQSVYMALARAESKRLNEMGINSLGTLLTNYIQPLEVPEYNDKFILPLAEGRISSSFGERKDPFGKKIRVRIRTRKGIRATFVRKRSRHDGLDIAMPRGTDIPAANKGIVFYAGPFRGYGNTVILAHQNEENIFYTIYAHADKLLVKEGDNVEKGQPIAKLGGTGHVTGPHLHFEFRSANSSVLNPLDITKDLDYLNSLNKLPKENDEDAIDIDDVSGDFLFNEDI